jgi:hypothetical protein
MPDQSTVIGLYQHMFPSIVAAGPPNSNGSPTLRAIQFAVTKFLGTGSQVP